MSIIDKLKRKTTGSKEDMVNWLMKQPVGELTDYLAYKLKETGEPVAMTIMYLDVKYTITCEEVDANELAKIIKEKIEEL